MGEQREQDLRGHVVVVTGGGRGFGRHVSVAAAEAGATLALVGRTAGTLEAAATEINAIGGTARWWTADVGDSNPAVAEQLVDEIEDQLGPIDALVNNAGILGLGAIATVDPTDFWHAFEVNVRGPFLWARAVAPRMITRGRGRIVNITSGAAYLSEPNAAAYEASKAALSRLTAVLAAELKPSGVTAFALAPVAPTEMLHELTVSDAIDSRQRAVFQNLQDNFAAQILETSLDAMLAILAGRLDQATGEHIAGNQPLSELLAGRYRPESGPSVTGQLK